MLPPLESLGSAKLSDVPDGYRTEAGDAVAGNPENGLRNGDGLLADELEECNKLALERTKELLEIVLDPDNENYAANLRAINSAIGNIFTMSARTNDTAFRRHALDKLPEILKLIKEEEQKLPGILIEGSILR